ncbi:Lipocalin 4 domain containing protein [Flavobacterium aquidurense]|uniref:Lipocalin 4 domain containing protein n=2 Tax=Flavobacterium aquidurense TaxID=362413 RepID=A0A0Q0S4G7_9FLAO|nr:Lipocalin 4 domain containing protein [Flavobacterium aquidurense]
MGNDFFLNKNPHFQYFSFIKNKHEKSCLSFGFREKDFTFVNEFLTNKINKKMKKLSILFLSVLTLGLASVSCSSDDDNSGSIEGKWAPVKMGSVVNGQEVLVNIPNEGKCDSDYIEYTSGGKFTELEYEFQNNKCTPLTDKGTWTLKDKILSTTYDGETEVNTVEIMELNKSSLKVKYTEKIDDTNSMIIITLFERK